MGHPINTLNFDEDWGQGQFTLRAFPFIQSALDNASVTENKEMKSWLFTNGAKSGYEILNAMSLSEIEERFRPKNRGAYRPTADDLRFRAEPTLTGAVLGLLSTRDTLYVVCRTEEKMDIDGMSDYWLYIISDGGKRGLRLFQLDRTFAPPVHSRTRPCAPLMRGPGRRRGNDTSIENSTFENFDNEKNEAISRLLTCSIHIIFLSYNHG